MIISLLFSNPVLFMVWIIAILLALTVHEFAHAWMATKLGDDTPQLAGRLTLNPIVHLDFYGFIMLLFVGFGWGKPVPFNPYMLKNKKWGPALVGLAGPASNLIVFMGTGILFKLLYHYNPVEAFWRVSAGASLPFVANGFALLLLAIIMINIMIMIFNLIPIPPLDGSKVLFDILPTRYNNFKYFLETRGPFILLGLILVDSFLPISIFGKLFNAVLGVVGQIF